MMIWPPGSLFDEEPTDPGTQRQKTWVCSKCDRKVIVLYGKHEPQYPPGGWDLTPVIKPGNPGDAVFKAVCSSCQ